MDRDEVLAKIRSLREKMDALIFLLVQDYLATVPKTRSGYPHPRSRNPDLREAYEFRHKLIVTLIDDAGLSGPEVGDLLDLPRASVWKHYEERRT